MAKHDQILTEVGILCTAEKQQHIGIVENLCQFFITVLKVWSTCRQRRRSYDRIVP